LATGLFGVLVLGCGASPPHLASPPPSDGHPYQARFDELRADAESDFVRTLLEDGTITEAEFEEALHSEVQCLRDAGLNPVIETDDLDVKYIAMPSDEVGAQGETNCWEKWDGGIVDLYPEMRRNPNNVTQYDLWAACLVQQGLVPAGLTGDQLREVLEPAGQEGGAGVDGETWEGAPPEDPDPALPNGLRPLSDDTHGCMVDPVGVMER